MTTLAAMPAGWVSRELDQCEALLAQHLAAAVQRFGSAALSVIDLPSLTSRPGQLSADQLRAAAVLYWASEIEQAGIPGFAEALAAGMLQGRLVLPLVTGGDRLLAYWRARHERFDAGERRAMYQRLFGATADNAHAFPPLMAATCAALVEIGQAGSQASLSPLLARAVSHARDLATLLSQEAVGITAFAGRDIVANIRSALALLRDRDISITLGALGIGVWGMIERHAQQVMGQPVDPEPHLERARAGFSVLSWLADNAAALETGQPSISAASPVVQAAIEWQAAGGGA